MGKTVLDKMGFKPGMTGWAPGRPDSLALTLPISDVPSATEPSLIIGFVDKIAQVGPVLDTVLPHYARGKSLWFAYPKRSGCIRTDITRDRGWEPLGAHDLLPVTQVAIDDDWSALRFRYRDEITKLTRKTGL